MQAKPFIILAAVVGLTVVLALALSTSSTAAFAQLCGGPAELVPLGEQCPEGSASPKTVELGNNLYRCCLRG